MRSVLSIRVVDDKEDVMVVDVCFDGLWIPIGTTDFWRGLELYDREVMFDLMRLR